MMVLFDDYFQALPDLGQDGMEVAGKFSFGDTDRTNASDDTCSSSAAS
jgi:hypothetical protein